MKCVDVEVILFKHRPASAESKPKSNLFFTQLLPLKNYLFRTLLITGQSSGCKLMTNTICRFLPMSSNDLEL